MYKPADVHIIAVEYGYDWLRKVFLNDKINNNRNSNDNN